MTTDQLDLANLNQVRAAYHPLAIKMRAKRLPTNESFDSISFSAIAIHILLQISFSGAA
jgi:hypothetical protein